jgi:hypothetical protein
MYPHVTQFETRTMQIDDEIRVRAQREALRRPTQAPGPPRLRARMIARLVRAAVGALVAFFRAETRQRPVPSHPVYWP